MVLGAAPNEIALAAFLLIMVLLAAKIGRIGEAIGALFERNAPAADGGAPEAPAEPQEDRQES